MKKLLSYLSVLFLVICIPVFAETGDVSIENIRMTNSSRPDIQFDYEVENNMISISLDDFEYEGDFIEYQITLKNHNTNKDYSLVFPNLENGVVTYQYEYDQIIASKEEKVVTARVSYISPLSEEELAERGDGVPLQFQAEFSAEPLTGISNPKTASSLSMILIFIVVFGILLFFTRKYSKIFPFVLVLGLLTCLFQPVIGQAAPNGVVTFQIQYHIYPASQKYRFHYQHTRDGLVTADRYCTGLKLSKTIEEVYNECVQNACEVRFKYYDGTDRIVSDPSELMLDTSHGFYECISHTSVER